VLLLTVNQSLSAGFTAKVACIDRLPAKLGVTVYVTVCTPSAALKYPSPFSGIDKKVFLDTFVDVEAEGIETEVEVVPPLLIINVNCELNAGIMSYPV
jgi:hypothetical protein